MPFSLFTIPLIQLFFFFLTSSRLSLSPSLPPSLLPSALWRGSCQWHLLWHTLRAPTASRSLCFKGQQLISYNGFHFVLALHHAFDAMIGSAQGGIPGNFPCLICVKKGGVNVITMMSGQDRNHVSGFSTEWYGLCPCILEVGNCFWCSDGGFASLRLPCKFEETLRLEMLLWCDFQLC